MCVWRYDGCMKVDGVRALDIFEHNDARRAPCLTRRHAVGRSFSQGTRHIPHGVRQRATLRNKLPSCKRKRATERPWRTSSCRTTAPIDELRHVRWLQLLSLFRLNGHVRRTSDRQRAATSLVRPRAVASRRPCSCRCRCGPPDHHHWSDRETAVLSGLVVRQG